MLQKAANNRKAAKEAQAKEEEPGLREVMGQTSNALAERGERLQQLDTKFADLNSNAGTFLETIKKMNEKEEKKRWFEI